MANKIRLSGEIGFDITSAAVIEQLDAARGEDLEVDIASVGGSVYDGIEIYNAILDYGRNYPNATITIRIEGLAASMASYIAACPAASLVVAEKNAILMVHHPWNLAVGNFKDMQKNAEFLEGLSGLLGKAYQGRTKKPSQEIAALMDAETYLFGSEIKDAGFVDEMLDDATGTEESKGEAVAKAQLAFQKLRADMRGLQPDPERAAAVMRIIQEDRGMGRKEALDALLKEGRITKERHAAAVAEQGGRREPLHSEEGFSIGTISEGAYVAAVQALMEGIEGGDMPASRKAELLAQGQNAIRGIDPTGEFQQAGDWPTEDGMATDDQEAVRAFNKDALRPDGSVREV